MFSCATLTCGVQDSGTWHTLPARDCPGSLSQGCSWHTQSGHPACVKFRLGCSSLCRPQAQPSPRAAPTCGVSAMRVSCVVDILAGALSAACLALNCRRLSRLDDGWWKGVVRACLCLRHPYVEQPPSPLVWQCPPLIPGLCASPYPWRAVQHLMRLWDCFLGGRQAGGRGGWMGLRTMCVAESLVPTALSVLLLQPCCLGMQASPRVQV